MCSHVSLVEVRALMYRAFDLYEKVDSDSEKEMTMM